MCILNNNHFSIFGMARVSFNIDRFYFLRREIAVEKGRLSKAFICTCVMAVVVIALIKHRENI